MSLCYIYNVRLARGCAYYLVHFSSFYSHAPVRPGKVVGAHGCFILLLPGATLLLVVPTLMRCRFALGRPHPWIVMTRRVLTSTSSGDHARRRQLVWAQTFLPVTPARHGSRNAWETVVL